MKRIGNTQTLHTTCSIKTKCSIFISNFNLGPGPAKYNLPPTIGYDHHDITKTRLPHYSIGLPQKTYYKSEGPGPGPYNIEHQTRFGRRRYPGYIGLPLKDLSKLWFNLYV